MNNNNTASATRIARIVRIVCTVACCLYVAHCIASLCSTAHQQATNNSTTNDNLQRAIAQE